MTQDFEKRKQALAQDQMYCSYCAAIVKKEAESCPNCRGNLRDRFQQPGQAFGNSPKQPGMQNQSSQNIGNKDMAKDKQSQSSYAQDRPQNQAGMQSQNAQNMGNKDRQGQSDRTDKPQANMQNNANAQNTANKERQGQSNQSGAPNQSQQSQSNLQQNQGDKLAWEKPQDKAQSQQQNKYEMKNENKEQHDEEHEENEAKK